MKLIPPGIATITLSVVCINLLIWGIAVEFFPKVMLENHLIENIQAASLFLGGICFSVVSYKSKSREFTLLFLGLSLLYLTFFVRELDIVRMDAEIGILSYLKSKSFLYGLVVAWVALSVLVLFRFMETLIVFRDWLITTNGNLLVAAGFFYVMGDYFEKNLLGLSYGSSLFYEEFLEIIATTLMLLCAAMRQASKKSLDRQAEIAAG